nr:chromatin assembly factor 1 subunit FAS1 [Tanacetum cinerariifolium]
MCLQALSIRVFPLGTSIEISTGDDIQEEVKEASPSSIKSCVVPAASGNAISDSDLPEFVSIIQSCPHGINKVVKNLHLRFPNISKAHLGDKVREISVFANNRWQDVGLVQNSAIKLIIIHFAAYRTVDTLSGSYSDPDDNALHLHTWAATTLNPVIFALAEKGPSLAFFLRCSMSFKVKLKILKSSWPSGQSKTLVVGKSIPSGILSSSGWSNSICGGDLAAKR